MAKVTFEFDDIEDNDDVKLVVDRHKLICLIYDIQDLYRRIYNGKLNDDEYITVKDGKVLTEDDYKKFQDAGEYPVKDTKEYIDSDFIENELDRALEDVRHLLD